MVDFGPPSMLTGTIVDACGTRRPESPRNRSRLRVHAAIPWMTATPRPGQGRAGGVLVRQALMVFLGRPPSNPLLPVISHLRVGRSRQCSDKTRRLGTRLSQPTVLLHAFPQARRPLAAAVPHATTGEGHGSRALWAAGPPLAPTLHDIAGSPKGGSRGPSRPSILAARLDTSIFEAAPYPDSDTSVVALESSRMRAVTG